LTALGQVKEEIVANRTQYRKDAEVAYHSRMLEAQKGKAPFPRTRTFRKLPHSTNSVYSDLEEAERFDTIEEYQDIGDLTWEQKEKVLRALFAEMNGHVKRGKDKTPSASEENSDSLPPIPQDQPLAGSIPRLEQVSQTRLSEEKLLAIDT